MCVITAIPKTALDLYLCMAVDIYIFAISHKILIGVIISSLPLDIGKNRDFRNNSSCLSLYRFAERFTNKDQVIALLD
jgi:hypothetical protein